MSELVGLSIAAMQTRQASLARQCTTVADADHVLAEVLTSAYSVIRDSLRRLNAIADEVDRAVTDQDELALNTPMGAHEFKRFLVAKQREIVAIVADSRGVGREKTAALEALRTQYAALAD